MNKDKLNELRERFIDAGGEHEQPEMSLEFMAKSKWWTQREWWPVRHNDRQVLSRMEIHDRLVGFKQDYYFVAMPKIGTHSDDRLFAAIATFRKLCTLAASYTDESLFQNIEYCVTGKGHSPLDRWLTILWDQTKGLDFCYRSVDVCIHLARRSPEIGQAGPVILRSALKRPDAQLDPKGFTKWVDVASNRIPDAWVWHSPFEACAKLIDIICGTDSHAPAPKSHLPYLSPGNAAGAAALAKIGYPTAVVAEDLAELMTRKELAKIVAHVIARPSFSDSSLKHDKALGLPAIEGGGRGNPSQWNYMAEKARLESKYGKEFPDLAGAWTIINAQQ
ncbi:MAG: hypothetical protein EXS05_12340 [Planctomycetaceae bacterium]|nr:hypothetical protein [Planctomycetaceae bacterium]